MQKIKIKNLKQNGVIRHNELASNKFIYGENFGNIFIPNQRNPISWFFYNDLNASTHFLRYAEKSRPSQSLSSRTSATKFLSTV